MEQPGDPQPFHRPFTIEAWREAIGKAREDTRDFERSMDAITRAINTTPAEVADLCRRILDRPQNPSGEPLD